MPAAGHAADVLSDVLQSVRLTGAVYFDFDLSSPWVAEAPPSHEIARIVMPGAQRVIEYHLIARGACWGHAVGDPPLRLVEGDLILFPQGDPHVLSSAPGLRGDGPDLSIFVRKSQALPIVFEQGGGGPDRARIVCCFLGLDERPFNPLLKALPRTIHLNRAGYEAAGGWIATLLNIAVRESGSARAGRDNILARMSELMFVEAIRRYIETLPASHTGWLAGLRDPLVGQALAALHGEPAAPWTVESLARAVGASRSVLADRFTELVGEPPMQYLALWRMQLASRRLLDGDGVAETAAAVGYESQAAFSRAFKRLVGEAPGTWRASATRSSSSVR
ncbi:MAG TPA: AraC family transcriptional regulator [Vicinamibacterales bacterium]|nr:AraC family transcriptional regulator [Vicinamibacterales bacterium]